jgi:hypothetical protein
MIIAKLKNLRRVKIKIIFIAVLRTEYDLLMKLLFPCV